MSAQQSWALQQALFARLTSLVAGQAPDGSDVEVVDEPPRNPDRLHVRLDDLSVFPGPVKCDNTRHTFQVNVYDRPTTQTNAARGRKTAKLLQQVIIAGLLDWTPNVPGAGSVQYEDGPFRVGDQDGLTAGMASRFSVYIAQS